MKRRRNTDGLRFKEAEGQTCKKAKMQRNRYAEFQKGKRAKGHMDKTKERQRIRLAKEVRCRGAKRPSSFFLPPSAIFLQLSSEVLFLALAIAVKA